MSGETWKLLDWFNNNRGKSTTRLAINSNLGAGVDVDRLLDSVEGLDVDIYTSQESVHAQAEYIRDGLDYGAWLAHVRKLLDSGRIRTVHCMATINALCLITLPDLLTEIVNLKRIYGRDRVSFTLNILRFPSFQSPLVLPDYLRNTFQINLTEWLRNHLRNPLMHEHELNHLRRLIDYLDVVKTPHSEAFDRPKLHNDFGQFYQQYDTRRNKNFAETFPLLADWYAKL
jgi:hypothetical protein